MISIITPVYNGMRYLQRHWESVKAALGTRPFEVIYVDNASDDRSLDVISDLALQDPRVVSVSEAKRGAAAARNKALSVARGDVYVFLDVDDLIIGDALDEQLNYAYQGYASYCRSLIEDKRAHLFPAWDSERSLNFWLCFGNQGALSSFVCPANSINFQEYRSSEDWGYVYSTRRFTTNKVRLVRKIGRIYDSGSGYSHLLEDNEVLETHIRVCAITWGVSETISREILSWLYGKTRSIGPQAAWCTARVVVENKAWFCLSALRTLLTYIGGVLCRPFV